MSDNIWAKLREPFPAGQIGKLPRGGTQLDYVGHADVTSRLLEADPTWNWEPLAIDENGMPRFDLDDKGRPVGLWIRLTVGGVARMGYGSCPSTQSDAVKVLIGDALRNAAMRFGVALDLWAKGDRADPTAENPSGSAGHARRGHQSAGDVFENSAPARPASNGNANGNGNGTPHGQAARLTAQAAHGPEDGIDEEAQGIANEAHECRSVRELMERIYITAEKRRKLTAYIAAPGDGTKGQLGPYLNFRRKALEATDVAWGDLHKAAEALHMDVAAVEDHVRKVAGKVPEAATAADVRKAIEALKAAA